MSDIPPPPPPEEEQLPPPPPPEEEQPPPPPSESDPNVDDLLQGLQGEVQNFEMLKGNTLRKLKGVMIWIYL